MQSTAFESLFRESGHVLYQTSAYFLEGRVEQDWRRGLSFLVERVRDLREALEAGDGVPEPRSAPSSGAFIRAGRRRKSEGRRAI